MRANGKGTIDKRGVDSYRVTLSYGRDPITGKYRRSTATVHGNKADARRRLEEMRNAIEGGLNLDAKKLTFGKFSDHFQESRKAIGDVTTITLAKDKNLIRILNYYLSDVLLADIGASTVQAVYVHIRQDNPSYSDTYMHMLHIKLKQIFKEAMNHDLIMRNPCDKVPAPRISEPTRRSLSEQEVIRLSAILDDMGDSKARLEAVRIALATGMRKGEILGLTWGSVDFAKGSIYVMQSLNKEGSLKQTKTKAGKRLISVDDNTMQHLRSWKTAQAQYLLSLGIRQSDDTPVITNDIGGWQGYAGFDRWRRKFFLDNGYPGLKLHELRHTQATLLVASGADLKTVQTRLGHANPSLTLSLYAHAVPERDREAADTMGSIFDKKPTEYGKVVDL